MSNPRRTNGHRRDQVCRRVLAEETHCALCGGPVDKTLGIMPGVHSRRCAERGHVDHRGRECHGCVYHPKSPVVDEIVPVALGGSPVDRGNCQLACRDCNLAKGDGTRSSTRPRLAPIDTPVGW